MKETCERCGVTFKDKEWRYACAKACTYCERCSTELEGKCQNCGGPLERLGG